MDEAYITEKIRQHLKALRIKLGSSFDYQKISDRFTHGIPDYYITYKGHTLWLELKAPGEKPRKIQQHVLNRLALAGNEARWSDNLDHARLIIDNFVSKWADFK